MPDLQPGDFVYQADQELFLVVMDEDKDSYQFAVHGWRDIDKERLDEYIDHQSGKLYRQHQVEDLIESEGNADTKQKFNLLKRLFAAYGAGEFTDEGPHTDFALEDQ